MAIALKPIHTVWIGVAVACFLFLFHATSSQSPFPALSRNRGPAPRFVFVDLGANSADTLDVFLQHPNAKNAGFEFSFPRPTWATYEQAEIFLFEANPFFNRALLEAKANKTARGISVEIFPSTVVDTVDGTRTFYLDTVNADHDFWGSSIFAAHPDAVHSGAKGTVLSAVNVARWLLANFLPHDFVVVKMDIEGAEYEVVPHFAQMSVSLVVDHLFVEWHNIGYTGGTVEDQQYKDGMAHAAIKMLMDEGVNMPGYNSGN